MKKLLLIVMALVFLAGGKAYADDVLNFSQFNPLWTSGSTAEINLIGNFSFGANLANAGAGIKNIIGNGFTLDGAGYSGLNLTGRYATITGSMTFQNFVSASSGGAVYLNTGSTITFSSTTFRSNTANFGGAVFAASVSSMVFDGSMTFDSNHANVSGGAIFSVVNPLSLTQRYVFKDTVTFINNTAADKGGAVYLGGGADINFASAKFYVINNMAEYGGFLYATCNKTIDFYWDNMTIEGNYATYGGTLYAERPTGSDLAQLRFRGTTTTMSMANSTAAYGGVIALGRLGGVDFSPTKLIAENNRASHSGGFLYVSGVGNVGNSGQAMFNDSYFIGNTAGNYGGAIYSSVGLFSFQPRVSPIREYVVFRENSAGDSGGAIYAINNSIFHFTGGSVEFRSNSAGSGKGGAIYGDASTELIFSVTTSLFMLNSAGNQGGALYLESGQRFTGNVYFTTNSANMGGAIYVVANTSYTFNSITEFIGNYATTGGAIYNDTGSTVTFISANSVKFENNRSTSNTASGGGAIYNKGYMNLGAVTFSSNSAQNQGSGGAIYNTTASGLARFTGTKFEYNTAMAATLGGGAIFNNNGAIVNILSSTTFTGNSAAGSGGAIYNAAGSTVTIAGGGIVFALNKSSSNTIGGGAIYNLGYLELSSVTFSSNSTSGSGGALYIGNQGIVNAGEIGFISFIGNEASQKGGAIYLTQSSMTISSSVFSGNKASSGGAVAADNSTITFNSTNGRILFTGNTGAFGNDIYSNNSIVNFHAVNQIRLESGIYVASNNNTINKTGTGELYISSKNYIQGLFSQTAGTTTINQANFEFANGTWSVTSSSGVRVSSSILNIGANLMFTGNVNTGSPAGGAMYIANSTAVFTGGISFINNSSSYDGGAISSWQSTMSFIVTNGSITFGLNRADYGGAILAHMSAMDFIASGSINFSSNCSTDGGAINTQNSTMSFKADNIVFRSNSGDNGGGAISAAYSTMSFIADNNIIFSSNSASGSYASGGAICAMYSTMSFKADKIEFSSNTADIGGALALWYVSSLTFDTPDLVFNYNNSTDGNGVVYWDNSSYFGFGNANITAIGNQANNGGFLYLEGKDVNFNGATTLSGNIARSSGGAMYIGADTTVNTKNITLTNNTAVNGLGGAVYMQGADGELAVLNIEQTANTIIDGNKAGVTPNAFHLEQYAELNLNITGNMTVRDAITSKANTEITKAGSGLLLLNSNINAINGRLNIYGGVLRTSYTIGTGDIYFDNGSGGKLNITTADHITMFNNLYAYDVNSIIDLEINDNAMTMNGILGKDTEGYFAKNGLGKLIMSAGSSADLYNAIINKGEMEVLTDSFGTSLLTVNAQGILSGTGKIIGDVTNNVNGTVKPGHASGVSEFGILTIDGNYFESGYLGIRLNEGTPGNLITPTNDKLIITGNATINAGSKIDLDMTRGFKINKKYTVLESEGLTGIYSGLKTLYPSFNILIGQEGENVILYIDDVNTDYVEIPGLDHNNLEVAKIIDKITAGGDPDKIDDISKIIGVMDPLDDMGKKRVMEEVAGSIYANALLASGHQMRQAYHRILDRRESGYEGYTTWAGIYGSQGKREQDSNSGDFKSRNGYMILGAENYSDSGNLIMGYYASIGQHDTHQWDDIVDINDYRGGWYFGKFIDNWTIRAEFSGGYQQYKGQRIQKLLQSRAESEYDGWNINGNVEAFYKVYESNEFNLSPFAGLDGSFIRTSGFKEKGYGNAAAVLTVKDNQFEILNAVAGVRADKEIGILRWYGELGARYNLRGSKGKFKATLNNLNDEMNIYGAGNSLLSGKGEIGFSADVWRGVEVFAMTSYEKAEKFYQVVGETGIGYRFGSAKKVSLERKAIEESREAYKYNEMAQEALKEALAAAAKAEQNAKEAENATTIESSKEAARLAKEEAKKAILAAEKADTAAKLAKEAAERAAIAAKETEGLTKSEKQLRESRAMLAAAKAAEAAKLAEEAARLAREAAARAGKFSDEAEESSIKVEKEITMFKEKEKSGEIQLVEVKGKPKAKGFRLTRALFDFDKFDLKPDAKEAVAGMARALRELDYTKVTIEGHTDEVGDDNYNESLSLRRAKTVQKKLSELGIYEEKIETVGYGKKKPIASNATAEGRAQNRRVEIIVE